MKKLALSLVVLAASSAYVWNQWGSGQDETLLGLSPASAEAVSSDAPDTPAIDIAPPKPAAPTNEPKAEPAAVILKTPFIIDKPTAPTPPVVANVVAAPVPVTAANVATQLAPAPDQQAIAAVAAPVTAPLPRPRPRPHLVRDTVPLAKQVSMTVAARGTYADGTFTGPAVDAYYGLVQIQAIVQRGKLAGIRVLQYPSDRRTSVAINRQALPMLRDEAIQAQSANVDIVSGATLTSQAFARSLKGALMQATA